MALAASYLTEVRLRNFRGFSGDTRVAFAPLTFFVGPNSSGKSSISDAVLFLAQSRLGRIGGFSPRWAGDLVDLGSFADTVFGHDTARKMSLELRMNLRLPAEERPEQRQVIPLAIKYRLLGGKEGLGGIVDSVLFTDLETHLSVLYKQRSEEKLSVRFAGIGSTRSLILDMTEEGYPSWAPLLRARLRAEARSVASHAPEEAKALSRHAGCISFSGVENMFSQTERVASGRAGPQRWYSLGAGPERAVLGPKLFDRVDPALIGVSAIDRLYRRGRARAIERTKQMCGALSEMEIASDLEDDRISPYHSAIKVVDPYTGTKSNLMEVGYGASQVLPVIRGCISDLGGPLIVEQPEIHLHPKAQGVVADLLLQTSLRRQVVVETHSVRFLNRARIAVARGTIPSDHVAINFVSRGKRGSRVRRIELDSGGAFTSRWPGGFFDERYEDSVELLRIRSGRKT